MEASRAVLKRATWSPRGLPNFPAVPVQERATTGPEPPKCGFATTAFNVSAPAASPLPPSPQDLKDVDDGN